MGEFLSIADHIIQEHALIFRIFHLQLSGNLGAFCSIQESPNTIQLAQLAFQIEGVSILCYQIYILVLYREGQEAFEYRCRKVS